MSQPDLSMTQWMDVALAAAQETASSMLACSDFQIIDRKPDQTTVSQGAYVALHIDTGPMYVGVLSSAQGCEGMTRALLGIAADEESPDNEDITDAVSEIANIVAGVMSTQLAESIPNIGLGLPIFVYGRVAPTAKQKTVAADVAFNEIDARIVMIGGSDFEREVLR